MNDLDLYDYALTATGWVVFMGILLLGGPLWALVPIFTVCVTISLYRHLPLPPRRR
jgi:hypothetical protein